MSALGLSQQQLFAELPRVAKFDSAAAEKILATLRREVEGHPYEQIKLLRHMASFRAQTGDLVDAIQLGEELVALTRDGHGSDADVRRELAWLVQQRVASDAPDQWAHAEGELAELIERAPGPERADALLLRASLRLRGAGVTPGNDPDLTDEQRASATAGWEDLEQAARCPLSSPATTQLLLARAAFCRVLGRDDDGLRASAEAIDHVRRLLPDSELPPTLWGDRIEYLQTLYGYRTALLLRARPPRVREAFAAADLGRAQVIRQQLSWASGAGEPAEPIEPPDDAELRALLHRESAALALLEIGARESWVLLVDPAEPDPVHVPLALTRAQLAAMLPAGEQMSPARAKLFAALPALSAALAPAFRPILGRCEVLYMSPSSELMTVPFAGLTVDDGRFLAEHCATAYAPSAAVLRWCMGRRAPSTAGRRLVALGAGVAHEQGVEISFAAQARAVVERGARWATSTQLLPSGTTGDELLEAARSATVLHLECHGSLDPTASAIVSSFLVLGDGFERLDADRIAARRGTIPAELVFLNACLSGTFTPTVRNEIGGFWQAFLAAGAAALVATLVPVNPRSASELVAGFYENWPTRGLGRAKALQAAQLTMLAAGRRPADWATHILIGDGG